MSRRNGSKGVQMGDLKSKRLIVMKGILFLGIAVGCGAVILVQYPSVKMGELLAVLVWASCRFYYFLFYVLEKYVDPRMRYAGVMGLVGGIWIRGCGMRG